ncbi:MAG: DNRLRE domain-containing protein [Candidatus Pelethousia sp.]|nr:DNRLRE domain-containing protein [Candidatus Pelethousia sp.]
MSYLDLACRKSISLANRIKRCEYQTDTLCVGHNYKTYLFFELPSSTCISRIEKAVLILFKIPVVVIETNLFAENNQYCVRPLFDYFSVYSNWYMPPRADRNFSVYYRDEACMGYTEINITTIAKAWFDGKVENKGLLLTGAPNATPLIYASSQYETEGMQPVLRLTYEPLSVPLSLAQCTVKVDEMPQ